MKFPRWTIHLALALASLASIARHAHAQETYPNGEEAAVEYTLAEERTPQDGGEASYGEFDCYYDCRMGGLGMKFCWIACTGSPWPF
jgi:hypothetical protein